MESKVVIPGLTKDDIEVRVQSTFEWSESKNGQPIKHVAAILLLYKNARVDMNILDNVFGIFGWKRKHETIDGNLYCTVSVFDPVNKCWVDKQDVGIEAQTQKEKSEASDSFKRACFNLGIGRELYTSPVIFVELKDNEYTFENDKKTGKKKIKCKPSLKFSVKEIDYCETEYSRTISKLIIIDNKNVERFKFCCAKTNQNTQGDNPNAPSKEQVSELKQSIKALLDAKPEYEEEMKKIAERTNRFTNMTSNQCLDLILRVQELIHELPN